VTVSARSTSAEAADATPAATTLTRDMIPSNHYES
jgi:hypothetical protein